MIRCNNCGWYNPDTATSCEMCEESLAGFPKVEMPAPEPDEEDTRVPEPVAPEPVQPVKEEAPAVEEKPAAPRSSNPLTATIRFADSGSKKARPAEKPADKKVFAATVRDVSAVLEENTPSECPKCKYPVFGSATTCPNCGAQLKSPAEAPAPAPVPPPAPRPAPAPAPAPVAPPPAPKPAPQAPPPPAAEPAPEKEAEAKKPGIFGSSITVKDPVEEKAASKFKQTVRDFPKPEQPAPAVQKVPKTTVRDLKATIREIPAELMDEAPSAAAFRLIPVESPDPEVIELVPGEIVSIGNRRYKFVKE